MSRRSLLKFSALVMILSLEAGGPAVHAATELSLTTTDLVSQEPLTTDKIAELDPAQPNPHLRRWVVNRKMEIQDWQSRKLPGKLVGVQGGVLQGTSTLYLRSDGPWYSSYFDFPCKAKTPDPLFATKIGARQTAEAAAKLWDEMLSRNKFKLSVLLGHVAAVSEKSAGSKADRVFQEWLVRLDRDWRDRIQSEIIPQQWKRYRAEALKAGFCQGPKKNSKKGMKTAKKAAASSPHAGGPSPVPQTGEPTLPEKWMDQASGTATPTPPLTHAPSRRWRGLFAVRADVGVGESSALGQMLIDPATPKSVLSPDWMISQGFRPEWIEVPEAEPQRVRVIAGAGATGLGAVAHVGFTKISGYPISLTRYLLFDTALFDEPEEAAPCCAGVFGLDLFRRYVLKFDGAKPNSVDFWAPAGYRAPSDYQWVEVRETEKGELVPTCSERVKALPGASKLCQNPRHALQEATHPIIFDLPHGRLWYSPGELGAPVFKDISGVKLGFDYLKGDRVLRVQSLGSAPIARQLAKDGLRKGMVITDIDGVPSHEMDLWEVNRRMSGAYGETVTLKWKTAKGFQAEPLRVIQRELIGSGS